MAQLYYLIGFIAKLCSAILALIIISNLVAVGYLVYVMFTGGFIDGIELGAISLYYVLLIPALALDIYAYKFTSNVLERAEDAIDA